MKKEPSNLSLISKKFVWSQLKDFFEGEWVELVDYKWDWNQPCPAWARIRNHASDRMELLNQIREDGAVEGAVVLFIGNNHSTYEHSLSAAV